MGADQAVTPQKVYLDDQGNPIKAAPAAAAKVYLDDSGNPIGAPAPSAPPAPIAARDWWKDKPANRGEWDQLFADMSAADDARRSGNVQMLPVIGGVAGSVLGGSVGAAIGAGGGEAFRQLDNRLSGKPAPNTPTEAAAQIGLEGAFNAAADLLGLGTTKLVQKGASAVYRGYLKPSLSQKNVRKAAQVVTTAIREMLPISETGVARGQALVSMINSQVNDALRQATKTGVVDLHGIAENVRRFARRVYGKPGTPPANFDAVMAVADEIDRHPSLGLPSGAQPSRVDVSPAQANQVKQSLDRAIGDNFGVEGKAATEGRKVGRNAARRAIENVVPEIAPLNKREAEIIDALKAVTQASGRESNRNAIFGVPSLMSFGAAGYAGASGSDPVTAAIGGLVTRGLLTPQVASRAAFLSHRFARVPGTAADLAVRMGALIALRESEKE